MRPAQCLITLLEGHEVPHVGADKRPAGTRCGGQPHGTAPLGEIDFTVPLFGDYMKRWLPAPARTSKTGTLGERLAGEELHSQRRQVGLRHRRRVSGNLACQAGTTQDVGGFDARQEGPGARPPGELDQFRTQVLL